jgi:hypothetical protein
MYSNGNLGVCEMLNMAVLARSRPTSTYKPKICTVVYGDLFTGFDGTSSGNNNCVIESVSELCELAIRGARVIDEPHKATKPGSRACQPVVQAMQYVAKLHNSFALHSS